MSAKRLIMLVASILLVTLWGCGSSMNSSGDVTSDSDGLANAAAVGINNCLTCHNPATTLLQGWMAARHGNHLLAAARLANDALESLSDDPRPSSVSSTDSCRFCHRIDDSNNIDYSYIATFEDNSVTNWGAAAMGAPFVDCEACHGGGQYHNGIASGIPYPKPSTRQCAQCHYLNDQLANQQAIAEGAIPFHTTSSSGNNVRRNISDSHIDDPATDEIIEGYVVVNDGTGGCNDCHIAHKFDLEVNYQWANSPHGGRIKEVKDTVLAAGAPDAATLLTNVTSAGVDETTGDAWVHYDWDDTTGVGPGGRARGSCQRCHTSTGLMNFLADTANYDYNNNDFSHLDSWEYDVSSSGQNEMLYCWGCHSNTQNGELRDDPDGITLDFVNEDEDSASGDTEVVVLPDKGNSNVCGACHSGRGNNTSIRTGRRSSRFAGHHAPTAGSLYASITNMGFKYTDSNGDQLDYTTPLLEHDLILEDTEGPCVACHMGGTANHNFEAVDRTGATVITNQTLCDTCHGAIDGTYLDNQKAAFETARQILLDLVDNTTTNYLNADLTQEGDDEAIPPVIGYSNAPLNAYGAFQNSLYMKEEPCIYLHNSLYGKRLMFDSIDWLEDGSLDDTINNYGGDESWMGGTARP